MESGAGRSEPRYWAWEFPIAILVVVGTLVATIGIPFAFQRSTGWATLAVGALGGTVRVGLFVLAQLNATRAVAAAMFVGGASRSSLG